MTISFTFSKSCPLDSTMWNPNKKITSKKRKNRIETVAKIYRKSKSHHKIDKPIKERLLSVGRKGQRG